jgi:ketosteroid isomerase-like protein
MEHDIRNTNAALADAISHHDPLAIARLYSPVARLLLPGGQLLIGNDEIAAYWSTGIALGLSSLDLGTPKFELRGAAAVGRYATSVHDAGRSSRVEHGTYLAVHGRQYNGSWLRVLEAYWPAGDHDGRLDAVAEHPRGRQGALFLAAGTLPSPRVPARADGEEGFDGSSPSEGFKNALEKG